MKNIEFTRSFIELNNSFNYTLSIRIVSDGFCFCVFDNSQKKFIFFKNVVFDLSQNLPIIYQIKRIIDFDSIFTFPFAKIIIVYSGQKYTLLPETFYDSKFKKELLMFSHPLNDEENIKDYKIKGTDIINLYSLPTVLFDYFQQKFPNAFIHHQASLLIFDAIKNSDIHKQVHIDVSADFFYVNIVEKHKLVFSNAYSYTNANEFVYHIINLYDKLELNELETNLYFSGDIEKDGLEISILKDYIQHIIFADQSDDVSFVPDFQTIPFHEMAKLFVLCEL